jgi:hypothetical protein
MSAQGKLGKAAGSVAYRSSIDGIADRPARERPRTPIQRRPACSWIARQPLHGRLRGLLLGVLLAAPAAAAELAALDARHDRVDALVRRPLLAGDLVVHLCAASGEQLLQRRLEVHGVLQGLLDLRAEGLDDRLGGPLVAGVQVAGADHGLDHRGQHALGLHQRKGALRDARGCRREKSLWQLQALGHGPAGRPGHRLGADLRQAPRTEALGLQARIQVRRHRQPQHAVAEEGQARIGVAAPLAPGGVGEDLAHELLRQLSQQLAEQHHRPASALSACARTKSTAAPTVRILAACSSDMLRP